MMISEKCSFCDKDSHQILSMLVLSQDDTTYIHNVLPNHLIKTKIQRQKTPLQIMKMLQKQLELSLNATQYPRLCFDKNKAISKNKNSKIKGR